MGIWWGRCSGGAWSACNEGFGGAFGMIFSGSGVLSSSYASSSSGVDKGPVGGWKGCFGTFSSPSSTSWVRDKFGGAGTGSLVFLGLWMLVYSMVLVSADSEPELVVDGFPQAVFTDGSELAGRRHSQSTYIQWHPSYVSSIITVPPWCRARGSWTRGL